MQESQYNPQQPPAPQHAPQQKHIFPPQPKKNRIFARIFWSIVVICILLIGVLVVKAGVIGNKIFIGHLSFFKQVTGVISPDSGAPLQGESDGQINIMLMGYGGAGHDGPYLTDSLMLVNVRPNDKKVLMTSIPRDYYYVSASGEKINAVFTAGSGGGQDLLSGGETVDNAIGKLSGETIPYFVTIDFDGFAQAIDRIGGVDVNVENSFTDDQYPNGDSKVNGPECTAKPGDTASPCRYLEVVFNKGMQHMDGATALEFVRSRHASGDEGSDFARARRQQLVLEAFKSKVQQLNLFTNASTINDLLNILANHLHTNITLAQALHLATIVRDPAIQITSQSFDPTSNLVCPANPGD